MANLNTISVSETIGSVTVKVGGLSTCSNSELGQMARLLGEVLNALSYKGVHSITPMRKALKGSSNLKGLSVSGADQFGVRLGYQPAGNDSRAEYRLHTNPTYSQKMRRRLKSYIGTAYTGKPKPKPESNTEEILEIVEVSEVAESTLFELSQKPTQKPELFYSKDPDWMLTFVLHLSDLADKHPEHRVTKDQVFDLAVERTHFSSRFGIAPIYTTLMDRGYLVPVTDIPDTFTVVESPAADFKGKRPWAEWQKSTPKPAKAKVSKKTPLKKSPKKRGFMSDEDWVRSCMEALASLVEDKGGLISRTDLNRFIIQQTKQNKHNSVVNRIYNGLKVLGYLHKAGDKLYKVEYKPAPDTAEKAVADIKQAREETAKTFEGFRPVRLPLFAEGLFESKKLLNELLGKIQNGVCTRQQLQEAVAQWYPDLSGQSYLNLFNYMMSQGYLIRQKLGQYALGPTGLENLGIIPTVPKIVEALPSKEMKSFLPEKHIVPTAAPAVAIVSPEVVAEAPAQVADKQVTEAIAAAFLKAREYKNLADACEAEAKMIEEELSEVRKKLDQQPDIEGEAQRRLMSMIADL